MAARLDETRTEHRNRSSDADFRQQSGAVPELRCRPASYPDTGLSDEAKTDLHGALPRCASHGHSCSSRNSIPTASARPTRSNAVSMDQSYMGFALAIGSDPGKPIMAAPIALHCWMPAASRFERLKRSCTTQLSEAQLNAHPSHRCLGRPCARIARDHIRLVQWQAQSRTFENPFAHPALSHSAAMIQTRRGPLALTR